MPCVRKCLGCRTIISATSDCVYTDTRRANMNKRCLHAAATGQNDRRTDGRIRRIMRPIGMVIQ